MAEWTAESTQRMVDACVHGMAAAADELGRALGQAELQWEVGTPRALDGAPPAELAGGGLVLAFARGGEGALLMLPEGAGILPADWRGDAAQDKWTKLAGRLGALLLPSMPAVERATAVGSASLAEVLQKVEVKAGAACVPLVGRRSEATSEIFLICPAAHVERLAASESPAKAKPLVLPTAATAPEPYERLPPYMRSLLHIKVPVLVTLASKKQSVQKIVELGPGSIIKFDKPCDDMLELEIGGRVVAEGEAVKVGDKFGLRISSMVLPGEKFERLERPRGRASA